MMWTLTETFLYNVVKRALLTTAGLLGDGNLQLYCRPHSMGGSHTEDSSRRTDLGDGVHEQRLYI